ncbi:MAG: TonB-dependent receptor plug domain-containing protein [Thermodesulfovibrionales bacterium]
MIKVLRVFLSCILSLLIISSVALAEEKEGTEKEKKQKEAELEEIVVTATRTEKEITEAPASVSVVTKEEMEKRNIKAVDEALNTIPGVFNRRGKGLMDTLAHISLRGIPKANRTLILLDGALVKNFVSPGRISY